MPGTSRRPRRRRCPVCQTLVRPHPRLGSRQGTCGAAVCQQQRHAQSCRAWRRRNRAVTRAHYQDYVRPARAAARVVTVAPSPVHAQLILASVRPEWRDAIMAQTRVTAGLSPP